MILLNILSAGAAQAVVQQVMREFERDTANEVRAEFGAVGAMKARALTGTPADVMVLTDVMIDELIAGGFLAPRRYDLGKVGTGVAVRAGVAKPDIASAESLRASLRAASVITFPDPAIATAGKIVMQCFEKLGIAAEVASKVKLFPNGNAAMNWLAANGDAHAIGITQKTEILPIEGVTYAGALPHEFQQKATYAAGCVATSAHAAAARDFILRLTAPAAKPMLAAAGYEF
ncbi:MAG: ABC transporter substrate-binding protein [Betaproteobacteria bacterium]|nr:ABC transporter substrate-binding protein [Betaproteobacteria bacterium]